MNDETAGRQSLLSPRRGTQSMQHQLHHQQLQQQQRQQQQQHHQQRQQRPRREKILCYDKRYFCRVTLWLELMVGIIMTILGLFILLLSIESLKEGDYPAVYFCSSFIVLGVLLLLIYYIHYYALKLSIKRQVQRIDSTIKSDQDVLAALAKRSLQLSKIAVPRKDSEIVGPAAAAAGAAAAAAAADEANSSNEAAASDSVNNQRQSPDSDSDAQDQQHYQHEVEESLTVVIDNGRSDTVTLRDSVQMHTAPQCELLNTGTIPQSFSDFDIWETRQSIV